METEASEAKLNDLLKCSWIMVKLVLQEHFRAKRKSRGRETGKDR